MNEGYMSYILLLVTVILLASGWKNSIARGLSRRELFMFVLVWFTGLFYAIPVNPTIHVQGVYAALMLILLRTLSRVTFSRGCYLLVAGAFTGMISYLIHVLYRMDPVLIIFDPDLDRAAVIGLLVWTVSRHSLQQAAVLTIACLVGEAAMLREVLPWQAGVRLGGPDFQDSWWLALIMTRSLTMIGDFFTWLVLSIGKTLSLWMRGLRK